MGNHFTAKTYWADYSAFNEKALVRHLGEMDTMRMERIAKAARTETKCELLASGLMIREALKRSYGISNPQFGITEAGKPYLIDRPDIFFSLSHSKGTVVCTVSDTDCGVDTERIDEPKEMAMIANKFFSSFERGAIMMSAEPAEAFLRLWTLREAYVKMRGTGFSIGLSALACSFPKGTPKISENGILQEDAYFCEMRRIFGWRTAVCTKGEAEHEFEKIEIG